MIKKYIISALLMLCVGCLGSCQYDKSNKLTVLSTTSMIHDVVTILAGDLVKAKSLMGPGVDPHLYKASAGDIKKIAKADAIFYNGLHLEAKLTDIFKQYQDQKLVVAVAESISVDKLLESADYPGLYDPHVWFDVRLWITVTEAVKNALIKLLPEHIAIIETNFFAYVSQLNQLDRSIKQQIAQIPQQQRLLVTAHDAFSYFAKAYDFEVAGLQGISTVSEASIKDIELVAELVVDKQVPAIFIESSVPKRSIKALKAAVKALGHDVVIGDELYTDALGEKNTPQGTYIGMIKHNVKSIFDGLIRHGQD